MYAKTTEDLNGSNDDLIPPRMPDNAFGYAQLQLGADEVNTGNAPYSVVFNGSPGRTKKKNRQIIVTLLLILLGLLCVVFIALYVSKSKELDSLKGARPTDKKFCLTPGCIDAASFMQSAMDKTAKPCDNFYQYACGGWISKHPIPEKESRWGVGSVLMNENLYALRHALEEHDRTKTRPANKEDAELKAKQFYKACMQKEAINKLGKAPLIEVLKKFDEVGSKGRDKKTVLKEYLVMLNRNFSISALFNTFVEVDARNSSLHRIQISQSGLGLTQSRYAANMTDKVISAYINYMTKIHLLLGAGNVTKLGSQMEDVFNFEKSLAKIFVPRENMTEINKIYNKMTIGEFTKICNMIDWLSFYQEASLGLAKITSDTEIIVLAKPYLEKLSGLIEKTDFNVVLLYVHWRLYASLAPYLSDEFTNARKELDIASVGSHLEQPRWKTCVEQTDGVIGFAIGSIFVKRKFRGKSKSVAANLVEELRRAFIASLPRIEWMDDETRRAAKEKALAVFPKIGYPEKIMDPEKLTRMYQGVQFSETSFFQNMLNYREWMAKENIIQLTKPVDKTVWYMTPSTVNAYYDATRNQIVFPAGILQPPYYDIRYPMSVNFGGIGAVIGHELLHGFDNSGRLYDKNGNSGKLWWTKHAVEEFKKKEKCFIDEYGQYVIKGKHINGKVTLGENIADNGGLKAAYNAYKAWVKKNGEEPILPGLDATHDQLFFISFGQSWCTSARTAALLDQLDTDSHSPAMDRVLGSISNSAEFAKVFKCPAGSKYNPKKKCNIW
ncbi:endothelin-converting enzyme homolog [Rhopilema esculentum]|uniref:endothelin-converting enzyme homolog n=1 Tax=Rhopilema esculentum TaxID=499914 RepID=UPI0031E3D2C9